MVLEFFLTPFNFWLNLETKLTLGAILEYIYGSPPSTKVCKITKTMFKVRLSVHHVFACIIFLCAPCFCVHHIQVISIFGIGLEKTHLPRHAAHQNDLWARPSIWDPSPIIFLILILFEFCFLSW